MGLPIAILFMIIMAIVANKKGFNPWLWFLAAGLPGFIILLALPSANAVGIDEEMVAKRQKVGNKTGGIITIIALVLLTVLFIALASIS